MSKLETRDPLLDTSGSVAAFYEREFFTFSNFSSFQVEWRGRIWQTSEHAYQAARYFEVAPQHVETIHGLPSAHAAYTFMRNNRATERASWSDEKRDVMYDIVRHKLGQHAYVQSQLLRTGDALIVEDSPKDSFWGWGPDRKGRNELGKIWMELREELRNGEIARIE